MEIQNKLFLKQQPKAGITLGQVKDNPLVKRNRLCWFQGFLSLQIVKKKKHKKYEI